MTVKEIADKLNNCANLRCAGCKYNVGRGSDFASEYFACQAELIQECAEEFRKMDKDTI